MTQVVQTKAELKPMRSVRNVCNRCVNDGALSALILEEGAEGTCDYCGATAQGNGIRTWTIQELAEQIHERITWEYGDVDSEMISYDNEEREYTCDTYTTEELLTDQIGLDVPPEVLRDLDHKLPDLTWCKKRFGSSDLAFALEMGWTAFIDLVKQDNGESLLDSETIPREAEEFPPPEAFGVTYDSEEGFAPDRVLDALGDIVSRANLIRHIKAGCVIFRVRVHNADEKPSTAAQLGPPPAEKANQPNRMSRAGTVMFYGAFDSKTAILETFQPGRDGAAQKVVSVAKFKTNAHLRVLDLSTLPEPPSFFGDFELHHGFRFLREFEKDFTKPVARDGMEHVDYLPTQIVTEYFRRNFRKNANSRLDGIIYNSSKKGGKSACVLFFDSNACGSTSASTLQLIESETVRIPGGDLIEEKS